MIILYTALINTFKAEVALYFPLFPDLLRQVIISDTDITQNTYIESWTVTEIMAREVWNLDSCYTRIDY